MTDTPPLPEEVPVEIHKPKPVHSWREFLKEYAIIVLGVATALAAEQGVEWLHWRSQVQEARQVIATELAYNLVGAINRVRANDCAERRLAAVALVLDGAARNGTLPPLGDIGLPPRSIWPTGAWDSVVASQTATHFPRQQLATLAASYKLVQRIEEYSSHEINSWEALFAIVGPGRRLDPASEAELRKALSQSLGYMRVMSNLSLQLITSVEGQQLPFTRQDLDRIAGAEHRDLSRYTVCRPVGPVPPSYGGANMTGARSQIDEAAKHLPDFSKGAR